MTLPVSRNLSVSSRFSYFFSWYSLTTDISVISVVISLHFLLCLSPLSYHIIDQGIFAETDACGLSPVNNVLMSLAKGLSILFIFSKNSSWFP